MEPMARGKGLLRGTLNLEDIGSDPGWPLSPGTQLSLLTWFPFSKVGEPGPGPRRPGQCPRGQGLAGVWLSPLQHSQFLTNAQACRARRQLWKPWGQLPRTGLSLVAGPQREWLGEGQAQHASTCVSVRVRV